MGVTASRSRLDLRHRAADGIHGAEHDLRHVHALGRERVQQGVGAAVGEDHGADQQAGLLGEQEGHQGRDLLGATRAVERGRVGVGEDPELGVAAQLLGHRGGDQAGGHRVHPDAGAGPLGLDALAARPVGERRLGRGVDVHGVLGGGQTAGLLLVVGQARGGHLAAPSGLAGHRVRADQDHARARRPSADAARSRARPRRSSSATRPAVGRSPVRPATPAHGTTPSTRSVIAPTAATAASRPDVVARSPVTSASCRSTPMTVCPSPRRRVATAAPMPEAEPLTTYVPIRRPGPLVCSARHRAGR